MIKPRRLKSRQLELIGRTLLGVGLALLAFATGVFGGAAYVALASVAFVAPLPHPLPRVYHGRHRYGDALGTETQRLRWGVDWTEGT